MAFFMSGATQSGRNESLSTFNYRMAVRLRLRRLCRGAGSEALEGDVLETCTILTTEANQLVAQIAEIGCPSSCLQTRYDRSETDPTPSAVRPLRALLRPLRCRIRACRLPPVSVARRQQPMERCFQVRHSRSCESEKDY
jgi:hypothetical protein